MLKQLRSSFLYAIVVVFVLLSGFSYVQYTRNASLLSTHIQLSAWSLAQLELEHQKFYSSLSLYQAGALDHKGLMFSYDMLWNRLTVFLQGKENAALRSRFGADETVSSLFALIRSYEPIISDPAKLTDAELSRMHLAIEPFTSQIREIMVLNFTGPEALSRMDSIRKQQHLLALNIAGLVLSGLILVVYLLRQNRKERFRAMHDSLTGLYNRGAFQQALKQNQSQRHAQLSALALIDLSRFRDINSAMGQAHGDELLIDMARLLVRHGRKDDLVARLDSDHFAILMTNLSSREETLGHLHLLQQLLMTECLSQETRFQLEVRAGICFLHPELSSDQAMSQASLALIEAKKKAVNTPVSFAPAMAERSRRQQMLSRDLRTQLLETPVADTQLYLVYQPIYDMQSQQLRGAEVLIRWSHPTLGAIPPMELIDMAESHRLGQLLGDWIFNRIGSDALVLAPGLRLSVNLSPSLFNHGLPQWLLGGLQRAGLTPEQLMVEITENTVMASMQRSRSILHRVRDAGIEAALDDFGTGYSSLSYLRELPVDKLKIDKSFIQGLSHKASQRAFVGTMMQLANHLQLEVVAEGIETEEDARAARQLGCQQAQGFFFSYPLEASAMRRLLPSLPSMPDTLH
ncbi:putative bifunctional diguanylate cyclase/phosphodiesterase [Pokkaliibacter sp. CJK22405]|uniref:putative bifunctional diguanylate cyclase/phosphodiesterase n=1 Tax=Pokkaliibacter sp. CJK22405 TaxID=3384615 RepID=UPI003984E26B